MILFDLRSLRHRSLSVLCIFQGRVFSYWHLLSTYLTSTFNLFQLNRACYFAFYFLEDISTYAIVNSFIVLYYNFLARDICTVH